MLPAILLGDHQISRLIVGGNPFSGNSHIDHQTDEEMQDFFTAAQIKQTLFECENNGINAMQLRADRHILRIIREYRKEGGRMHWIAQTTPELASFEACMRQIASGEPAAVYHHGTDTDALFKAGNFTEIERRIKLLRQLGCPVGLGTHMPEVITHAEKMGWGLDFYMACVYNLSRADRVSSAVTGRSNQGEPFCAEDIPVMYQEVRRTSKPCLVFKILGASRRCQTQEEVAGAFREAFANIKKTDAVVVGMYPKYLNQIKRNAEYTRQAIELAERSRSR